MRVSPVSFGGLSILEISNKGINSTRHCPRSPVGQNTFHQESLAPRFSPQRDPKVPAVRVLAAAAGRRRRLAPSWGRAAAGTGRRPPPLQPGW